MRVERTYEWSLDKRYRTKRRVELAIESGRIRSLRPPRLQRGWVTKEIRLLEDDTIRCLTKAQAQRRLKKFGVTWYQILCRLYGYRWKRNHDRLPTRDREFYCGIGNGAWRFRTSTNK